MKRYNVRLERDEARVDIHQRHRRRFGVVGDLPDVGVQEQRHPLRLPVLVSRPGQDPLGLLEVEDLAPKRNVEVRRERRHQRLRQLGHAGHYAYQRLSTPMTSQKLRFHYIRNVWAIQKQQQQQQQRQQQQPQQ